MPTTASSYLLAAILKKTIFECKLNVNYIQPRLPVNNSTQMPPISISIVLFPVIFNLSVKKILL